MRASEHLLVTEIPTGKQHQISLQDLRDNGPIHFGRLTPVNSRYIQLGLLEDDRPTDALNWISKWQCTVFAERRPNDPRKWDYWLQDGAVIGGEHIPSSNGIFVGNTQLSKYNATQLRPGPGRWQLFRKASGIASGYHCILEWEAIQEPGDDTNQDPPTFQEFQEIQQQKRVFQEQVNEYSQQLQSLGKRMAVMQQNFDAERADLSGKLNDQSTMLFQISGKLESEQDLNQKQQRELASQRKRNHQVKIALVVLSVLVAVIAVVGAGIDVELIQQIAEWTLVIIGAVGALFGAMGLSEG